jgi:hypothetical protein
MSVTNFVAVDHVLSVIQDTAAFEAYTLSVVFANAAARARVAGQPGGLSAAETYYSAWISSLGQLGWTVREAASTRMANAGGNQTTSIASAISTRIQSEAPEIPIAAVLMAVKGACGEDPAPGFSFWWEHGTSISGTIHVTFANVSELSGTLKLSADVINLDSSKLQVPKTRILGKPEPLDCSSFSCLFSEVLASSVDLHSHAITATLDLQAFAPNQAELQERLGSNAQSHIVQLSPDLLSGELPS